LLVISSADEDPPLLKTFDFCDMNLVLSSRLVCSAITARDVFSFLDVLLQP